MNYKDTLNLPRTSFAMKANLRHLEPKMQQKWEREKLYERILESRKGSKTFILHDGPPYANGDVHIGTGLNKILKDIVVKFKTMQGYYAPYVPGWDCHGLPIEHKVMQETGKDAGDFNKVKIIERCRKYAFKYIDIQRKQFKSLGVLGDWENPYLTMAASYEAGIIHMFGKMVEHGYVYKSKKPIHWCMSCKTALAEAELEYSNEESPSIFVLFPLLEGVEKVFPELNGKHSHIMIWTTTPWTLPANLACAVHPEFDYSAISFITREGRDVIAVLAKETIERVMDAINGGDIRELGTVKGKKLEGLTYRHNLTDRTCPVVLADYVTLTEGTGVVHTAPGHGREDCLTGARYNLDILSPVDADGVFTEEAGGFSGMHIYKGNKAICEYLRKNGFLLHHDIVEHSYPHCWRCKRPVIFRATDQWFLNVDHNNLRGRALDAIGRVRWIPGWGQTRISSMVELRPDWCLSRQRTWGVPIPAFYCEDCDEALLDKGLIDNVEKVFEEKGIISWHTEPIGAFLPEGTRCKNCGGKNFRRESDILDVWFDSGVSHYCVLRKHPLLYHPGELYLEGTDQHRGWFQTSLLAGMAADGVAPFKTVLTHGFVVDEEGKKMSKSLGNLLNAEDVAKEVGADVMRLWISSIDYTEEINVSKSIIAGYSDAYRRIRNTIRYLLGNTYDFDPNKDALEWEKLTELDRWAYLALENLVARTERAYEQYQFHRVYQLIYNFCVVEMGSFYLDVLKDRLYTWEKEGRERRSAQTVMWQILEGLLLLSAPILVHTAEEAWEEVRAKKTDYPESVHLVKFPAVDESHKDEKLMERWAKILELRSEVTREMEKLRAARIIGNSLKVAINLATEDEELYGFLSSFPERLETVFIVSEVTLSKGRNNGSPAERFEKLYIEAKKSEYQKCERCWNFRPSVGKNEKHPTICDRCIEVVEAIK